MNAVRTWIRSPHGPVSMSTHGRMHEQTALFFSCLAGGNGVDGLLSKLERLQSNGNRTNAIREEGWFYHRSIWIDLTGDGRESILTARAKRPKILNKADNKVASNKKKIPDDPVNM